MGGDAGLNGCLLVRADDVIVGAKGFIAPKPRIKIEDDLGLLGKMRVAREDPVLVSPRFQIGFMEDAPHRAAADRLCQGSTCPLRQVRQRLTAQRPGRFKDNLAGKRFHDGFIHRGKNRAFALAPVCPPRRNRPTPTGDASAGPNPRPSESRQRLPSEIPAALGARGTPTPPAAATGKNLSVASAPLGPRPRIPEESQDDGCVSVHAWQASSCLEKTSIHSTFLSLSNQVAKPGHYL